MINLYKELRRRLSLIKLECRKVEKSLNVIYFIYVITHVFAFRAEMNPENCELYFIIFKQGEGYCRGYKVNCSYGKSLE